MTNRTIRKIGLAAAGLAAASFGMGGLAMANSGAVPEASPVAAEVQQLVPQEGDPTTKWVEYIDFARKLLAAKNPLADTFLAASKFALEAWLLMEEGKLARAQWPALFNSIDELKAAIEKSQADGAARDQLTQQKLAELEAKVKELIGRDTTNPAPRPVVVITSAPKAGPAPRKTKVRQPAPTAPPKLVVPPTPTVETAVMDDSNWFIPKRAGQ